MTGAQSAPWAFGRRAMAPYTPHASYGMRLHRHSVIFTRGKAGGSIYLLLILRSFLIQLIVPTRAKEDMISKVVTELAEVKSDVNPLVMIYLA